MITTDAHSKKSLSHEDICNLRYNHNSARLYLYAHDNGVYSKDEIVKHMSNIVQILKRANISVQLNNTDLRKDFHALNEILQTVYVGPPSEKDVREGVEYA